MRYCHPEGYRCRCECLFYDRDQKISQLHYDLPRKSLVLYHCFALFPDILVDVLSVTFKTSLTYLSARSMADVTS